MPDTRRGDRPSILTIDDDADSHRITQFALRPLDAQFHAASDGIASIAAARRNEPDLIILDLGLPAGGRLHRASQAQVHLGDQRDPRHRPESQDASSSGPLALRAGADVYLQKPADPGALYAAAVRLLTAESLPWA